MGSRRGRMEILADILRIAKGGARVTRVVYGANLNFKLFKEYLEELKEAGLVVEDGKLIRTTEKGAQFLNLFQELRSMLTLLG